MRLRFALLAAAALAPYPAVAQTVIVPAAPGSGFETGTTVSRSGAVTTIAGGTQTGGNLFHSFTAFSLDTGETARWTAGDPASVTSVINRVTGGSVSTIKGTLSTSGLPNANFYFINPAGIVLGDGFRLDVAGAAHFSTAQELRFADGARFSATTPNGSTFTVAAPSSFGFLGGQGNITVSDPSRSIILNGTIGLSAANVAVNDSTVIAGGLRIAAVGASTLDLGLTGPQPSGLAGRIDATNSVLRTVANVDTKTFDISADSISLQNSRVQTDAGPTVAAADVVLTAKRIDVVGGSQVLSVTNSASRTGDIRITADSINLDFGEIRTRSNAGASGDVGAVMLDTGALSLSNGSFVTASTFSTGKAGVVAVDADTVTLATGSTIASAATDAGDAGLVQIKSGTVTLSGNSTINGSTRGAGHAGAVSIEAGLVDVSGQSTIKSETQATGDGGNVTITADRLNLSGGGIISSSTRGAGNAGDVVLNLGTLVNDAGQISSSALAGSTGTGGRVLLTAGDVSLSNRAAILSETYGPQHAGAIDMTVSGTLSTTGSSFISAGSFAAGHGGDIFVRAGALAMSDGAFIASEIFNSGDGGRVDVTVGGMLSMDGGTAISSSSREDSTGNAGGIKVTAGQVAMTHGAFMTSTSLGSGNGGGVMIAANGVLMDSNSSLSSDSAGDGQAGGVGITASTLTLRAGAYITSQALGDGGGGIVNIAADTVALSQFAAIGGDTYGAGEGGKIAVIANKLSFDTGGFIATRTYGSGSGGGVSIKADTVLLESGAITANAEFGSTGTAGNIGIEAGAISLVNGSSLGSDSFGSGDAGRIGVAATRSIAIGSDSEINTNTFGAGSGGNVHLDAPVITLADEALVSSNSFGAGVGGAIEVKTDTLTLSGGSRMTANGVDTGAGGDVFIDAGKIAMSERSVIAARAFAAASGGLVKITTGELTMNSDSFISSSTEGTGNAGRVEIAARDIAIGRGAEITSEASDTDEIGRAGNAGSIVIAATNLRIDGGRIIGSTQPGAGNAGDIKIETGLLSVKDGTINTSLGSQALPGSIGIIASDVVLDHGTISADLGDLALPSTSLLGITAKTITLLPGSAITAVSRSAFGVGSIDLRADTVDLVGPDTQISTSNAYDPPMVPAAVSTAAAQEGAGAAGSIRITATSVAVREGAVISSNSVAGPAGNIDFAMPVGTGLLRLEGVSAPGVITTSSGPGTGGVITIRNPLSVITNGGTILAQGQQGGAFVVIASRYFIRSADRRNIIKVDGSINIDANLYDVSAGLSNPGLYFLDSSKVLSGQCAAARASGETSQISAKSYGPYVPAGTPTTNELSAIFIRGFGC